MWELNSGSRGGSALPVLTSCDYHQFTTSRDLVHALDQLPPMSWETYYTKRTHAREVLFQQVWAAWGSEFNSRLTRS